jgi:hypothetical protein
MDREMQLRLYEPYVNNSHHIRLSEFPVDDNFVNPGVGVQMYDFFVNLNGKEDYEQKKKTEMLPASLPEKNNVHNVDAKALDNDIKQEGFGNKDYLAKFASKPNRIDSSILSAMSHATIKTDKINYVPSKKRKNTEQKGQGVFKRQLMKDNFKLV